MNDSGDIPLKHPYSKLTDLQLLEIIAVEGDRASRLSKEDPEYAKRPEWVEAADSMLYLRLRAHVAVRLTDEKASNGTGQHE
jgi:hypothetical protein